MNSGFSVSGNDTDTITMLLSLEVIEMSVDGELKATIDKNDDNIMVMECRQYGYDMTYHYSTNYFIPLDYTGKIDSEIYLTYEVTDMKENQNIDPSLFENPENRVFMEDPSADEAVESEGEGADNEAVEHAKSGENRDSDGAEVDTTEAIASDLTGLDLIKSIDVIRPTDLTVEAIITWEDNGDVSEAKYYYDNIIYRQELGMGDFIEVAIYHSEEDRTYVYYADPESGGASNARYDEGNYVDNMILDADKLEKESEGEIIAYFVMHEGEQVLYMETERYGLTEQAWVSLKYFIPLRYETQSDGWAYSAFEVQSIEEGVIPRSVLERPTGVAFLEDVN
jgi:outer membrane lipoprotein-sorting protein